MGQGQPAFAAASPPAGKFRRVEDVCEIARGRRPLGQGSFGTVWRAYLRKGGVAVAVKELEKRKMVELEVPAALVLSEVEFMRECNGNDRFVQLIDFIETKGIYFIVLEFCDGGNLEDAAKECEGRLGERQAVHMMRQMLEGICFLHSRNICHRDIKPQNVMLVGNACSEHVKMKLGDLGIAARFKPGEMLLDKVGTPAFMAPELHLLPERSSGYDHKVDMWAIGVVLVFLLSLEYPFVDGSGRLLRNQLLRGDLPLWDMNVFSGLFQRVQEATGMRRKRPSRSAQDLIRLLLNPKRQNRPSAARSLQHTWFKPGTDYEDRGDDLPLLKWSDFEDALPNIERELQRVASGVSDAAAGMAHVVGGVAVDIDVHSMSPRTEEEQKRRAVCHLCRAPSSATCHVCPLCKASVCFPCAKKRLARRPKCPHCGDVKRNAAELSEFIAAGEAWDSVAAVSGLMEARASEVMGVLMNCTTEFAGMSTRAWASLENLGSGMHPVNAPHVLDKKP
mmetsp:Transcript_35179/g.79447  ORF Transcript_35179/g.79447 Transcript_35179/m.79447 type:complete len:506 (-) Transcript_35179:124-1641(-)